MTDLGAWGLAGVWPSLFDVVALAVVFVAMVFLLRRERRR